LTTGGTREPLWAYKGPNLPCPPWRLGPSENQLPC